MSNTKTQDIVLVGLFTTLMIVGAFLRIPLPVVPLTFQAQFAIISGLLLGYKRGGMAVLIYIIMGLIGLPVFSQGGGIGYIFYPTFGYIIGFLISAVVCGYLAEKVENWSFVKIYGVSIVGMAIIFAMGMLYFYFMKTLYLDEDIEIKGFVESFLLIPLIPGLLKTAVFTLVALRIKPVNK